MAAITWTDVTAHYPGLAPVGAPVRDDVVAAANEALSASVFGGEASARYKLARIHYAAHLLALEQRGAGGSAGPISAKTAAADSLSVSYGGAPTGDDALLVTAPGTALYFLMRTSPRAQVFIPGRR